MQKNTKKKIIEASVRLFTKEGYKRTTTKVIAQEANVNEVTIFRHFGSKKGIVEAIVKDRLPYLKNIKNYFQKKATYNLEDDLIRVANIYFDAISKNIEMLMILSHEMGPDFQETFSIIPTGIKKTLIQYFSKMQENNKVININPEQLAVSFVSSNIGFAIMKQLFNDQIITTPIEKIIKDNIKIFIKGISI